MTNIIPPAKPIWLRFARICGVFILVCVGLWQIILGFMLGYIVHYYGYYFR